MKTGPDIARIAALLGDPARANLLTALMGGRALTSSELALEAGVTRQTISSHLARLADAGLIVDRRQGRHRYWTIADETVAALLESVMGLAARLGATRVRTGPKEPALRKARICYDHLAGEFGVRLHEASIARGHLEVRADGLGLTPEGSRFFTAFGIDLDELAGSRRPLCRACLDWSLRRSHLAGALGAACLTRILDQGWARREKQSRIIAFSPAGEQKFLALFDPRTDKMADQILPGTRPTYQSA